MDLPVIHTSDRMSFKGCRERWNWLSDLREGYKPVETPKPLYFGTAIHAALEVYYNPVTWAWLKDDRAPLVHAAALQAFYDSLTETKKRYLKITGREFLEPEQKEEWESERALGAGMLKNYFAWAPTVDKFTPIAVEGPRGGG